MIEPVVIPVDLKVFIAFAGVMVPICIWYSKVQAKMHKKIHKRLDIIEEERLDVIEEQVRKIHTRLDNNEEMAEKFKLK